MNELDDGTLLSRFDREGSQEAFRVLAERHAPLVYSTCLRQLSRSELAEDATQAVFLILSQKASKIRVDRSLVGWLYGTSLKVSKSLGRKERRRMAMETPLDEALAGTVATSQALGSELDQALARLRAVDREAIVLRYFQGLSLEEVGRIQGASEDATRMRIGRALRRMRPLLAGRPISPDLPVAIPGLVVAPPASLMRLLSELPSKPVPPQIHAIAEGAHIAMSTITQLSIAAGLGAVLVTGGYALATSHVPPRSARTRVSIQGAASTGGPAPTSDPYLLRTRYWVGQTLLYSCTLQNADVPGVEQKLTVGLKVIRIAKGIADVETTTTIASSTEPPSVVLGHQDTHKPLELMASGMPPLRFPEKPVRVGQKWASDTARSEGWLTFAGLRSVAGGREAELSISARWPGDPGSGTGTVRLDSNGQIVSLDWNVGALSTSLGTETADGKPHEERVRVHIQRQ
jgi:RNA polymerase sigma factor (sigma-70 family)